jgi:hypothetical protein
MLDPNTGKQYSYPLDDIVVLHSVIPCPRCNGTGSNTAVFPITGCSLCSGGGKINNDGNAYNTEIHGVKFERERLDAECAEEAEED